MLFDLMDYYNSGLIGEGKYVPERTIANTGDPEDSLTTLRATRDAHYKAVNEYTLAAMSCMAIDKRTLAIQKYFEWIEARRNFSMKYRIFSEMLGSIHIKPVDGGIVLNTGDLLTTIPAEQAPEGSPIYVSASGGLYYVDPTSPEYGYNDPQLLQKLSGEISEVRAIVSENGWLKYRAWSSEDYAAYLQAVEELMASEKELFIACEGGVVNLNPVQQ